MRSITKITAVLATALALFAPLTLATSAFAYDPLQQACSAGGGASSACKGQGQTTNPLTGSTGVLTRVADILSIVAGAMVVIMMIVGGIKYVTSNGDSSQASSAKNTIIYGLVGLIVVVLARTIVSLVISKVG